MTILIWLESSQAPCWTLSEAQHCRLAALLPNHRVLRAESREEFSRLLQQENPRVAVTWHFRQEWFRLCPALRYLVTPAAGMDYFSVDPPPGVTVTGSSFHGPLIAETALGMLLSHARQLIETDRRMHRGEAWPRWNCSAGQRRFAGSTVTLLGFGNIGQSIAAAAKNLGARIVGVRRSPAEPPPWFGPDDHLLAAARLAEALPNTDHLVLALPGGPSTDRLVDAPLLARLPTHAGLYNLGRGNAVDEAALIDALSSGRLGAAYLDVFAEEPLPADSPLRSTPRCYLMPHASAAVPDYLDRFIDEFAPRVREWGSRGG